MTAWVTFSPSLASASAFIFCKIMAETSGGLYSLPARVTRMSPLVALLTLYGMCFSAFWTSASSNLRPMKRLTLKIVFSGLVIACRRATWPTRRSLVFGLTATTDGVRRLPSAFSSTVGSPASMIAATELVVPRSMPSTLAIVLHLAFLDGRSDSHFQSTHADHSLTLSVERAERVERLADGRLEA